VPKIDTLDRREFAHRSVMLLLGGVTITLSGCAGDGPTQPTYADAVGTVGTNHGHAVMITGAVLSAGGGVTLDIQGTSSHPHQVTLTSAEVISIREGRRVSKESTPSPSGSHAHTVTFN
jgi:hypothetical protein